MGSASNHHEHAPQFLEENSPRLTTLLTLLSFGMLRFFTVPQGFATTITAWGRFQRVARPGLRFCVSLLGTFERAFVSVRTSELIGTYDNEVIFTGDGVKCVLSVVMYYRFRIPEKVVFDVADCCGAIEKLVQAVLRNECGRRSTTTLLSSRDEMSSRIKAVLDRESQPWGVEIRLAEISNIRIADHTSTAS
jgi:regulator of protease activity HflC (stomatin/prohibitin superfamily)